MSEAIPAKIGDQIIKSKLRPSLSWGDALLFIQEQEKKLKIERQRSQVLVEALEYIIKHSGYSYVAEESLKKFEEMGKK